MYVPGVFRSTKSNAATQRRWKRAAFNVDAFNIMWEDANILSTSAEDMSQQLSRQLEQACDASMPRSRYSGKRRPTYWWTNEIADIRRTCLRARRRAQRARHRPNHEQLQSEYRARRRELKRAILQSKTRCFEQLRDSADVEPWGLAYKTIMQSVKGPRAPQPTCHELLQQIVATLFPPQEELRGYNYVVSDMNSIQPITAEEVLNALRRVQDAKVPGPDGIPNVAFMSLTT